MNVGGTLLECEGEGPCTGAYCDPVAGCKTSVIEGKRAMTGTPVPKVTNAGTTGRVPSPFRKIVMTGMSVPPMSAIPLWDAPVLTTMNCVRTEIHAQTLMRVPSGRVTAVKTIANARRMRSVPRAPMHATG